MPAGIPGMPAVMPGIANLSMGAFQYLGGNLGMPAQQMSSQGLGQYPGLPAQASPYMAGLGPAMDAKDANTVSALQTGQALPYGTQNPMVSAIQTQYGAQLQQYQQSQQQFADWAKKYEDYQKTVAAQQQMYQMEQQQYQQQQAAQQAWRRAAPKAALIQTGDDSARASALAAREKALAARGKALASRESALRKKAEQVRGEEVKEEQEQAQLDARAAALAKKEKQVQVMEGELVQEQRKIWKVLKSRQGAAPAAARTPPAQPSSPQPPTQASAPQPRSQPPVLRPAKVLVEAAHPKHAPLALAQMATAKTSRSSTAKTSRSVAAKGKKSHRAKAHRSASVAGTAAAAAGASGATGRSDLHIVMAANVPKEGSFENEDADDDAASDAPAQATSVDGEDSKDTSPESVGATGDNDDLEQILLQQSSNVQGQGDPVESF